MKLEKIISEIFHPVLLVPIAAIAFLNLYGIEIWNAFYWISIWVFVSLLPTTALVWFTGEKRELNILDRSNRQKPFLVGLVSIIFCLGLFWRLSAPSIVLKTGFAGMLASVIFGIANNFIKVSIHTGAVTFIAVLYSTVSQPVSGTLLVSSMAVGWSRVELNCHTQKQVVYGGLLGIACGLIFLVL